MIRHSGCTLGSLAECGGEACKSIRRVQFFSGLTLSSVECLPSTPSAPPPPELEREHPARLRERSPSSLPPPRSLPSLLPEPRSSYVPSPAAPRRRMGSEHDWLTQCGRAQATRGVKTLSFAGVEEQVYERADWPLPKLQAYFKDDTLALIGQSRPAPPSVRPRPLKLQILPLLRLRIPRSRTRTQRPGQRNERYCRCSRGWRVVEASSGGRMGTFNSRIALSTHRHAPSRPLTSPIALSDRLSINRPKLELNRVFPANRPVVGRNFENS